MNDNTEPDFELSPDEEMGDLAGARAKIKKMRDDLKESQQKAAEYLDGWQRCKADSVNVRRDALQSSERAIERARDALVEDLLPVLDSFDMAAGSEALAGLGEEWQRGMGHIHNQLLGVLEQRSVIRYGKVADIFDPRRYEALEEVDDVPGESHSIVKVIRHGYASGDRIIRPAQVIVKK